MRLMNWFRNFMIGRYGPDHLSFTLMIASIVLSIFLRFVPVPLIQLLSYIPFGLAIYRMLSRNIVKRGGENLKFLNKIYAVRQFWQKRRQRMADRKIYRFTKCPSCAQKIRLPKGRGKLNVTCPKCGDAFMRKT